MMTFWKIITWLWPFIWEIVLGDVSFKEAIKTNKKKVAFVIAVVIQSIALVWVANRLVAVSAEHVSLKKSYEAMRSKARSYSCTAPEYDAQSRQLYEQIKNGLEHIKAREHNEH